MTRLELRTRMAVLGRWPMLAAMAAGLLALTGPNAAEAAARVALVIGNQSYESLSRLDNPAGDATAIAGRLAANGFEVFSHTDIDRADFLDALEEFSSAARGAELAVVFYAGHGMEVDGKDVLAPVDMEIACMPREARRAVPVEALFEATEGAENRIVLLDACRSDPFPMCPTRGSEGTGFRGLQRVTGQGSTLIASATLSGSVAADGGAGDHSPFAGALIARLDADPNVPFRDLLDGVAEDVRLATKGAQIPEVTSRGGAPKLCLAGGDCGGTVMARVVAPPPVSVPRPSAYKPGTFFEDCPDCPEMVVLPAGEFMLGSPEGEADRHANEGPQVKVSIAAPFAVSRREITFDEWETCALEGGCAPIARDGGWGRGNRPAIYVSYADASAYVAWLSASTGERYHLLSEAEWEYAARGGTTTAYAMGAALPKAAANVDYSLAGDLAMVAAPASGTQPTASYPPNPFGLFDMHGNVAEWVDDCWNDSHAGAPTDGSARGGDCSRRVVKGGAWYFEPAAARVAARASYPADKRLNVVGLRVARVLD